MRLLFRLLRKNVSFWQIAGFAVANLVGAVIVLFGIQAYKDAAQVIAAPDSIMKSNVLVLSKSVSGMTTLAGALGSGPRVFSQENIDEIKAIPGITAIAPFRTTTFDVFGSVEMSGFYASTEMFLESVPDEFLDIDPKKWSSSIDDDFVPVIIPKVYLNFFNYGFATARGVPQIAENLLSAITFKIVISDRHVYKGRIVGLTDRFNTILVPDDFLAEANERFGRPGVEPHMSRLIVQTDGANSAESLMSLIEEKGYVVDGGSEDSLRMLTVVRRVISIVVALGLLVSSLAFFLLLISILLMIEKNRYKNDTLHQLGYPDRMIAFPYQTLALAVDLIVWIVGCLITILVYPAAARLMKIISPDFAFAGPGLMILCSLGFCLFFAAVHAVLIRSKIRS